MLFRIFFFNDTATTEIYTLSLHDALPISPPIAPEPQMLAARFISSRWLALKKSAQASSPFQKQTRRHSSDRKSTRLNSSHLVISYAVFCLKKKKKTHLTRPLTATEPESAR